MRNSRALPGLIPKCIYLKEKSALTWDLRPLKLCVLNCFHCDFPLTNPPHNHAQHRSYQKLSNCSSWIRKHKLEVSCHSQRYCYTDWWKKLFNRTCYFENIHIREAKEQEKRHRVHYWNQCLFTRIVISGIHSFLVTVGEFCQRVNLSTLISWDGCCWLSPILIPILPDTALLKWKEASYQLQLKWNTRN